MNVHMLRVFCSVVQQQSFSRGAALNGISQSAATQCVRRIEEDFGTPLLERRKRPFVLTPEGQRCYDDFNKILEIYYGLKDWIRGVSGEITGTVRVAAIYSVGLHGMGNSMQEFMRAYPKATVRLEYLRPPEVYDAVLNGRADIGLVSYPDPLPELAAVLLRSERMILACHPGHPLADNDVVRVQDLEGEPLISFERGLKLRTDVDRYLRRHGVSMRVAMEFDNIETIKQAVEIGAGLSILPEPTVCKEVRAGTLRAIDLFGSELRRPIGLIHRERRVLTPTISRFVELLERVDVESLAEAG